MRPVVNRLLHRLPLAALLCLLAAALSGCASNEAKDLTEDGLYSEARELLQKGSYFQAIDRLRKLESNYPFGNYAESAQLSLIYAYYQNNEVELADAAAGRFIRLHPNHNNVDYAWYLRGMAAFPAPSTFFQDIFGTDLNEKAMENAERSFNHFSSLLQRFPDSRYATDARQRLVYLRNQLARHEVLIANRYLDYKAYVAAINRARYVVQNFQTATALPDALAVMVQSHHELGQPLLADSSLQVLRNNYPDYPALKADGSFDFNYGSRQQFSLTRLLTFGLLSGGKKVSFDTREQYGY